MFERPALLWLLVLAPLLAAPGAVAIAQGKRLAGALSALLRLAVFVALVAMLAGMRLAARGEARGLSLIVAMDQSESIASDQRDWMWRQVRTLREKMNERDRLSVLGFGRDVQLLAPFSDPRLLGASRRSADPGATDIAAALTVADGLFPATDEKRLVVLSDGNETQGRALAQLPALAEDGIRVFAAAPPRSATERVALSAFDAPAQARAHTRFAFDLEIESEAPSPIEGKLALLSDGAVVGNRQVNLKPGLSHFELPWQIERPGAYLMSAELSVPAPARLLNASVERAITVISPPRILVVANDPGASLISALRLRDYRVERAIARGLPRRAEDYLPYQAVILADATADSMPSEVQHALNRYVAEYGGGVLVTGDALRDDRFAGGELEKALPVSFRPQPPPPTREPIAVYLCIDRSNSMSYNSRYPAVRDSERIRYAKQAAIALLRQLDDTDYAGVIAFDSQPYVLSHLQPIGEARQELEERVERLEPGGGTDFKESLEVAQREILDSGITVRQVILITDGDTNRQYHDHDALITDFADKHIPVSTIRIGPDLANLRLLEDFAQATGGLFYRVEDIEKLPQLLVRLTRKAMDQSPQGEIHIRDHGQSAILSGIKPSEIPPLELYTTTAAKPDALIPLTAERAKERVPLLAVWQYGLGRAVVFAADTDSLAALSWVRWNRYAEFWSQLVSWTMRPGGAGMFDLRVDTAPDGGLVIRADKADTQPVGDLVCRINAPGRAFEVAMTQTGAWLYAGQSARLPRGKYTATLMRKAGDTEQVFSTREFAVPGAAAADALEASIKPPNLALLRKLAAETGGGFNSPVERILKRAGEMVRVKRNVDPWLIPVVIGLLLAEIVVRRRFTDL